MQDNPFDKQFMDNAWSQMNNQLDEVMPQKRKRRFAFWWWFLPSLGATAMILLLLLPNTPEITTPTELIITPADQKVNNIPIAQLEADVVKEQQFENPTSNNKPNQIQNTKTDETLNSQTSTQSTKSIKQQTTKQYNNPIIPKEQDPVTVSAFQDPEAIVLHTTAESSKSDQRVAPAAPVTDLRFFNVFDPLSLELKKIQTINNPEPTALVGVPVKASKLIDRRGTAAVFIGAGYYDPSNQLDFAAGIGWKQKRGRLFIRLEPGLHFGKTVLTAPSNTTLDNVVMDMDTNFNPSSIPQEALGSNAIQNNIDVRFVSLSIPVTLGYQFAKKWSLEGGLQWTNALQLRTRQALDEAAAVRLQNGTNASFAEEQGNANLRSLLEQNSWLEGRAALNFRWSKRVELQAAYRFGQVDFANSDQLVWNRNQYALRLRYRLR